jgi:hypothetical protein
MAATADVIPAVVTLPILFSLLDNAGKVTSDMDPFVTSSSSLFSALSSARSSARSLVQTSTLLLALTTALTSILPPSRLGLVPTAVFPLTSPDSLAVPLEPRHIVVHGDPELTLLDCSDHTVLAEDILETRHIHVGDELTFSECSVLTSSLLIPTTVVNLAAYRIVDGDPELTLLDCSYHTVMTVRHLGNRYTCVDDGPFSDYSDPLLKPIFVAVFDLFVGKALDVDISGASVVDINNVFRTVFAGNTLPHGPHCRVFPKLLLILPQTSCQQNSVRCNTLPYVLQTGMSQNFKFCPERSFKSQESRFGSFWTMPQSRCGLYRWFALHGPDGRACRAH